jgi:hypothetical protein
MRPQPVEDWARTVDQATIVAARTVAPLLMTDSWSSGV